MSRFILMTWDCIVVGGGAAGLSAALVLGRARRRTLVIDAGRQSNLPAHGIGGLLGQDGRPPADFYADARAELTQYPTVEVRAGEVVDGEPGFTLTLADGTTEAAQRVVLATGMDYRYPDVPGLAERWGKTAFHCPFCHGWEVRDRPLFVLDPSEFGPPREQMLGAWSDDVTLLTEPPLELRDDEIVLADGSTRPCGGLMIAVKLHQRDKLAARLGAEAAEPNMVVADALQVDTKFATTVPGLYAAGDLVTSAPSVASSIAAGAMAAAMAVHSLMLD